LAIYTQYIVQHLMNDPEGKKNQTIRRYLGLDPTLKVASSRVLTSPLSSFPENVY
jgi:hypothetical protein